MCETVIAMLCFMSHGDWTKPVTPALWCQFFFDAAIKAKFQYFISKQDSITNYLTTNTAKDGFMQLIKEYPEIDSPANLDVFGIFVNVNLKNKRNAMISFID